MKLINVSLLIPVLLFANNFDKGIEFFNNNEFENAKVIFEEILEKDDENAPANHWLGKTLLRMNDVDEAVDYLEEAISLDELNAEYHFWYGQALGRSLGSSSVFTQMLKAHDVLDAFEKTIELDPSHIGGYIGAANYYIQAPGIAGGDFEKAKQRADKLIELGSKEGHFIYIQILENENKADEAEKLYVQMDKEFDPQNDNYLFYNRYGYFLLNQERFDEAIEKFKKQVELAPDQANPYDSLGDGYRAAGRLKEALTSYKKAVEINPEFEASISNIKELENKLEE